MEDRIRTEDRIRFFTWQKLSALFPSVNKSWGRLVMTV